jgi:hypothetical protein
MILVQLLLMEHRLLTIPIPFCQSFEILSAINENRLPVNIHVDAIEYSQRYLTTITL